MSPIPKVFKHPENALIWSYLHSMHAEIERLESIHGLKSPDFLSASNLKQEISYWEKVLADDQNFPVVLAHGDLKPANAMTTDDGSDVFLIDFELSGPNYRGYDIMKLFRKQQPLEVQEASMRSFLAVYAQQSQIPKQEIGDFTEKVVAECHKIEPLTWLEAVVFFGLILHIKTDQREEWIRLAEERWAEYIKAKERAVALCSAEGKNCPEYGDFA
mmetsp:Transcript_24918/g.44312  ORF Transcript_24918/g.44312 Transcript_24918/m.44312 type:complete len:216 (+) Transcript_24918:434-1081(+)